MKKLLLLLILTTNLVFGQADSIRFRGLYTVKDTLTTAPTDFPEGTGFYFEDTKHLYVTDSIVNIGDTIRQDPNLYMMANQVSYAGMFFNDNTLPTPISTVDTPVKVIGNSSSTFATKQWTHTNGRLTFNNTYRQTVIATVTVSVTSAGTNDLHGFYIAKNGNIIPKSRVLNVIGFFSDEVALTVQAFIIVDDGDFIELFVENKSATANPTITDMNFIVKRV